MWSWCGAQLVRLPLGTQSKSAPSVRERMQTWLFSILRSLATATLKQHPGAAWAQWTSASVTLSRISNEKLNAEGGVFEHPDPPLDTLIFTLLDAVKWLIVPLAGWQVVWYSLSTIKPWSKQLGQCFIYASFIQCCLILLFFTFHLLCCTQI